MYGYGDRATYPLCTGLAHDPRNPPLPDTETPEKLSQRNKIRKHLIEHGTITPLEALNEYGCFRLGGRIFELRQEGMPIETIYPSEGKKYAIYKLRDEQLNLF
jgi:hypothetical protein